MVVTVSTCNAHCVLHVDTGDSKSPCLFVASNSMSWKFQCAAKQWLNNIVVRAQIWGFLSRHGGSPSRHGGSPSHHVCLPTGKMGIHTYGGLFIDKWWNTCWFLWHHIGLYIPFLWADLLVLTAGMTRARTAWPGWSLGHPFSDGSTAFPGSDPAQCDEGAVGGWFLSRIKRNFTRRHGSFSSKFRQEPRNIWTTGEWGGIRIRRGEVQTWWIDKPKYVCNQENQKTSKNYIYMYVFT